MKKNAYLDQVEEIQKYRKTESKKAGYDVGEEWAAEDWISKYAKRYREGCDVNIYKEARKKAGKPLRESAEYLCIRVGRLSDIEDGELEANPAQKRLLETFYGLKAFYFGRD